MKKGKLPFCLFLLLDSCYVCSITCMFSVFLYAFNYGGFRLYLLVGAVLGFTVYHYSVGRVVMFFAETIVDFLRRLFRLLVIVPLIFLLKGLKRIMGWIWQRTGYLVLQYASRQAAIIYTQRIQRGLSRAVRFQEDTRKGRGL